MTDLKVSVLCYGTLRYASKDGIENQTSADGRRALEEAIESGVNFIHSSYEYGTRWLTGSVLKDHPKRHELHHMIKANVPEFGHASFNKGEFRRQIEDALRELHTDRIAIVQHLQRGNVDKQRCYWEETEPERLSDFDAVIEPLNEEFDQMRQEGKVGYLTTFPYTMGYAKRAVESGVFSGVVAYFNMLETEMLDLVEEMKVRGQGFIGVRGLMAGLLTDRRIDRSKLPDDDRFRSDEYRRMYDQLDVLRSRMTETVTSWTDLALQFSIADDTIASTVVGINTSDQLRGILTALDGPTPSSDLVAMAHAVCTDFRQRFGIQGNASGVLSYQGKNSTTR